MITFEELAAKYPIQNVAPFGACVVVPGAEFDPDWEVFLGDQGCQCHFTDLDGKPVTLVQRKSSSGQGARDVFAPEEKSGGNKNLEKGKREKAERTEALQERQKGGNNWVKLWTAEEDAFLIELWNRTPRLVVTDLAALLHAKYPARSIMAVTNRVSALQQEGRIQSRFKAKRKDAKASREKKAAEDAKSTSDAAAESDSDLSKRLDVLEQAYAALSKAIAELKTLEPALRNHKHAAGSGEAMLPMEAEMP